jgi:hypothetical protein
MPAIMPLAGLFSFHINNHNHETILLGRHMQPASMEPIGLYSHSLVNIAFKAEIA